MNDCKQCHGLQATLNITTPNELQTMIGIIQENLANGNLVEGSFRSENTATFSQTPFLALPVQGPWPDFIDYNFKCALCGQLFCLEAETYHGRGGSWSPLSGDKNDLPHSK